jgi:sodium-dependent dicarboxylate transporter 2/3/5
MGNFNSVWRRPLPGTRLIECWDYSSSGSCHCRAKHFNKLLLLGLITTSIFLTELMSNVALIQIFIPVVFGIAVNLGLNPILLGMPITFGASMAFMFPVATPPNAIVFSSGHMKVKDMMRAGIVMNLLSVFIIYLFAKTFISWIY